MGNENNLRDGIFFKNGVDNCVEGAWNEYRAAGGGMIRQIGIHAAFIPPHASPDDLVGNSGQEYDAQGNLMDASFWYKDLTVRQALTTGTDITQHVIAKFRQRTSPTRHGN